MAKLSFQSVAVFIISLLIAPSSFANMGSDCSNLKFDAQTLRELDRALLSSSKGRSFSDGFVWRRGSECGDDGRYSIWMLLKPYEVLGNYAQHYLVGCHGASGELKCRWSNYHSIQRKEVDDLIRVESKDDVTVANRVIDYLANLSPTVLISNGRPPVSESVNTITNIEIYPSFVSVLLLSDGCGSWSLRLQRSGNSGADEFSIESSIRIVC